MKIIHTSDLHLGQIIYRHYDREDEHDCYFASLAGLCESESPDALIVSGDIFDIQQPSATAWSRFTGHFVALRRSVPSMQIIIIAGNHDSPSRIHAHRRVWQEIGTTLIGLPPAAATSGLPEGWETDYILSLPSGYIIVIPFMAAERPDLLQHLLDTVAERNTDSLPVVMTGHLAVSGSDISGHDFDIGRIHTTPVERLGAGYDYLALGHIHKPQTIGHQSDCMAEEVEYPSPVARYSGSALHVSCDEAYPHTISIVEIDRHCGRVKIRQHRINQLRHFKTLPAHGSPDFRDAEEALAALEDMASDPSGNPVGDYVRFRLDRSIWLPSDFNQRVYDIISRHGDCLRYNPKIEWTGADPAMSDTEERPRFEVAELQQMADPLAFIRQTIDQYPGLDYGMIEEAFEEIRREVSVITEQKEQSAKNRRKS